MAGELRSNGDSRLKYGALLIGFALLLLGGAFVLTVLRFDSAEEIVAIMGVFTALVGTISGAFLGGQVGQSGTAAAERAREDAEQRREVAEDSARAYALVVPPAEAKRAQELVTEARTSE